MDSHNITINMFLPPHIYYFPDIYFFILNDDFWTFVGMEMFQSFGTRI